MLTETTTIHPSSLLAYLSRHDPLMTTAGKDLLRLIPFVAGTARKERTSPPWRRSSR